MGLELGLQQKQWICRERIQCAAVLQMGVRELWEYLDDVMLENPLARWEKPTPPLAPLSQREQPDGGKDTLQNRLLQQLDLCGWSAEEMRISRYLIRTLDRDGYFRENIAQTAAQLAATPDTVEACLARLKAFDPPGVFAKDLKECLALQLDEENRLERQIVEQYLELLGKNRLDRIAEKLAVSFEQVQQACERIRSLNPRPSAGLADPESTVYAIPDVAVDDAGNVALHEAACPAFSCDEAYYLQLQTQSDPEALRYLRQKRQQIHQLQGYLTRRQGTLLALTAFLAQWQRPYLLERGELRPLGLRNAAAYLGIHVSTVSRAIRDKYIQTPRGLIPMAKLFARSVEGRPGTVVAVDQIKKAIMQLIAGEDKKKPLSDEQLRKDLQQQGLHLSRRAVTKYRLEMQILDSRGRKERI